MKVMEKQKTNYNEVADELVQEFREEAAQVCPGGAACSRCYWKRARRPAASARPAARILIYLAPPFSSLALL